MEKKFSKGKWKTLDKATFNSYQNVWSKALYIDGFNFCMYISGRTEEEVNANAKLIECAPDLLIELKKSTDLMEDLYLRLGNEMKAIHSFHLSDKIEHNKYLIKKATE